MLIKKLKSKSEKEIIHVINTNPKNLSKILANCVRNNNMKYVKILLDKGVIPEVNSLQYACLNENIEMIILLLNNGADVYSNSVGSMYSLISFLSNSTISTKILKILKKVGNIDID